MFFFLSFFLFLFRPVYCAIHGQNLTLNQQKKKEQTKEIRFCTNTIRIQLEHAANKAPQKTKNHIVNKMVSD